MSFGPRVAFGMTAFVQLLSALPLFGTTNVEVVREAPGAFRASVRGVMVFIADGWIAASYIFVWQIALFLSLGESFSGFGAAMALAARLEPSVACCWVVTSILGTATAPRGWL